LASRYHGKSGHASGGFKHSRHGRDAENHFRERRRPKYLFSGLTKCGCCGGGYAMISADLAGCSTARNNGTCNNRKKLDLPNFRLCHINRGAW
jgi:hypothetical protein